MEKFSKKKTKNEECSKLVKTNPVLNTDDIKSNIMNKLKNQFEKVEIGNEKFSEMIYEKAHKALTTKAFPSQFFPSISTTDGDNFMNIYTSFLRIFEYKGFSLKHRFEMEEGVYRSYMLQFSKSNLEILITILEDIDHELLETVCLYKGDEKKIFKYQCLIYRRYVEFYANLNQFN